MWGTPSLEERSKIINFIREKYEFVEVGTIGKSVLNRDIDFLKIGSSKKIILWLGAFHGMEWLTILVLLKFFEKICSYIQSGENLYGIDFKKVFKEKSLVVVPCVNPDGVEIALKGGISAGEYKHAVNLISGGKTDYWQANVRGVDLNHNYNANWEELHDLEIKSGITGASMTRYGGKTYESEPETKSVVNFCRNNPVEYAIAFHSQGEEIYYGFDGKIPKNSEKIANLLSVSSGYKLSNPEGLAVGGGFKDWFISEFNKPAFTVEIGLGKNPLPISDFENIYKKIEKMLLIAALI